MKKSIILVLTAALVLSLSAMVLGEDYDLDINVVVSPYAVVEAPEELELVLFDNNEDNNTTSDHVSLTTNHDLLISASSSGFGNLLDNFVTYNLDGTEFTVDDLANEVPVNAGFTGNYNFEATVNETALLEEDWQNIDVDTYTNTITLTVSAAQTE